MLWAWVCGRYMYAQKRDSFVVSQTCSCTHLAGDGPLCVRGPGRRTVRRRTRAAAVRGRAYILFSRGRQHNRAEGTHARARAAFPRRETPGTPSATRGRPLPALAPTGADRTRLHCASLAPPEHLSRRVRARVHPLRSQPLVRLPRTPISEGLPRTSVASRSTEHALTRWLAVVDGRARGSLAACAACGGFGSALLGPTRLGGGMFDRGEA